MATMERELESVDVEALMSRIREEVKAQLKNADRLPPPFSAKKASLESSTAVPVLYSEDLKFLNSHWHDWNAAAEITSHRKFLGKLIVRVKKLLVDIVWNYVLKGYFERERQFQMHLVRFLNDTAKYIDARDAEIFWQIITKVDNDVFAVNERIDRIYDEANATLRQVEIDISKRLTNLEMDRDALIDVARKNQQDLYELDTVVRGLERITALFSAAGSAGHAEGGRAEPTYRPLRGVDYLLLENRYRGSEEVITERMRDYVPLFEGAPGVVLDLGCGRGEFLALLREAKIEAVGIDINESMVACARQKGLHAILQDGLSYLEQLQDASIGGIFAAQVIEHLTRDQLETLLELAARKVKPGGRIAFETINPQSFVALASNFFRDPTHIWPLHPDTMRFMLEMKGIKTDQVMLRSPFPDGAMLQPIPVDEHLPARWQITLRAMNDNITRLNRLLFGYQDYCIVGLIEQQPGARRDPANKHASQAVPYKELS